MKTRNVKSKVGSAEFEKAVDHLGALSRLASARRPSSKLTRALHELSLWTLGELYQLEVVDIDGAAYWHVIDGWLQPTPISFGQSEIEVKLKLWNKSGNPVSGSVRVYMDGREMSVRQDSSMAVNDLAPGDAWEGTFHRYGMGDGIHRLSAVFTGATPNGAITSFDPTTGELSQNALLPTLAKVEQPYIAGNRDGIRAAITQLLGISTTGNPARLFLPRDPRNYGDGRFSATVVDREGVRRNMTLNLRQPFIYANPTSKTVEFRYWENGRPENVFFMTAETTTGDFYEDLPDRLQVPSTTIRIVGPLDRLLPPSPTKYVLAAAAPRVTAEDAPYELAPNGQVMFGRIVFTVKPKSTYDAVIVSGRWGTTPNPWDWLTHWTERDIPTLEYPINATAPLPEYDLRKQRLGTILRRVAIFSSVLEDRLPQLPAEIEAWAASATPPGGFSTLSASTSNANLPPPQGTPYWLKFVLQLTDGLAVRTSCVAFWPPNPVGTPICVVGMALGLLDLHLIEVLDESTKEVNEGRRHRPPSPYSDYPNNSGPAEPYPGSFDAGTGGSGTGGGGQIDYP